MPDNFTCQVKSSRSERVKFHSQFHQSGLFPTGRLYLRNLSYSCSEEELSELFEKYGPTTEVFLPVDKNTDKPKGFAFITFMMPEHAVQAFNELDGHIFQGRVLHILPAKPKISPETGEVIEAGN